MTMPINLVLVRHGQSEQNLASNKSREGDPSFYTKEFQDRHSSRHRLTHKGQGQAQAAGKWLKSNGMEMFDRRIVSDYIRAKETAALLDLHGPDWFVEPMLREREWGDLDNMSWEERQAKSEQLMKHRDTDSFYWVPPNGESIAHMTLRLRNVLDTLHRECSDKNVIIVCHGEVMWGFRFLLERLSINRWMELESSKEPGVKIFNCQVLHYSRRDPESGQLDSHLNWLRSVSPADPSNDGPGWQQIERRKYSNKDLLTDIAKVKPLFRDYHE